MQLDTPMPIIDMDVVEANLRRAQQICESAGVACWPHIKTHKSTELAGRQIALGAAGLTCQKLGEAEVMADAGLGPLLISTNVLGVAKHRRLAALHQRVNLTVSCDNATVARDLDTAIRSSEDASKPLPVLVECDTGRHRCGVTSPPAVADLAQLIHSLPGLSFAGLLIYPPNGSEAVAATREFVAEVRRLCAERDLEVGIISSGGTPNLALAGQSGETAYRSGTSIFNDRQMIALGAARPEDCALFVYASVVSHPEPGRIMLDAGSKTLTSDLAGFTDHGLLPDYPQARLVRFAEEHGFVDVSDCDEVPAIGEIVRILPNHVCPVVNLFDEITTVRGGRIVGKLTIDARGRNN
ncbi:alanine racemase [Pseudohoeflea coraliihabitans]|uniref:Alanine racemase n=1 Tax=Pseudohoeflea coraliihabitans TaxID=2860393 RepID=A0ABS6WL73_9HYPH|nr:alanine racemase [Pseudohoeflea sp. DP4N28-3]MBW3096625.1 alanine racemase [Pseudohoeflea sp. DP4N28-3]